MAESRLIGGYPVIGIRPTIDGRRGPLKVREGLEDQTMGMALRAKKLIEENVKYSNGEPVKVVIADTTIGRVAEAAACEEKFRKEGVAVTLTVTPCWCYGSETMDMNPHWPKAVWGFNGTERPGAVYLAAVMAAYAQKGLPAFSIYGRDVQDIDDNSIPEDVAEKILRFARASIAVGWMKNKSYVNIGGISMGIAGSYCDASMFQKYFGIRAEWVDMSDIIRRITLEIYDKDEYEKALAWIKANCKEGFDVNAGKDLPEIIRKSKVVPADKDWEFIAKFSIIVRDILYGNLSRNSSRNEYCRCATPIALYRYVGRGVFLATFDEKFGVITLLLHNLDTKYASCIDSHVNIRCRNRRCDV